MAEYKESLETVVALKDTYPIRKSKKQKTAFRDEFALPYIRQLGYEPTVMEGGSKNVVFGCDPNKAKYTITAHYDTPATVGIQNLLSPCDFWTFLVWQILLIAILFVPCIICGFLCAQLTEFAIAATCGAAVAAEEWVSSVGGAVMSGVSMLTFVAIYLLMLIGIPNKHNANDNTSGVAAVLEIARTLPENLKNDVCFVLFDNEEKGLLGSAAYAKKYKEAQKNTINLNLDCVGEGDILMLIPNEGIDSQEKKKAWLASISNVKSPEGKKIQAVTKGFRFYPGDNKNFKYGIGICAVTKTKFGHVALNLHTKKDTVLDPVNVQTIRDALIEIMSKDEGQHGTAPMSMKEKIKAVIIGFIAGLILVACFAVGAFAGTHMAEEDFQDETVPTETISHSNDDVMYDTAKNIWCGES